MSFPGLYEIERDTRPVPAGLFKTQSEMLELIRTRPPGDYDVYRSRHSDLNGVGNSESVGKFTRHANGQVTFRPEPDEEK